MNKIICEICGTSYPETATQCPICGCVRPADAHSVAGDTSENEKSGYTYVKGGRFSKANVRKRNNAAGVVKETVPAEEPEEPKAGKGLIITAVLLLLAIIAVVIYIAVRFLMPPDVLKNPDHATTTTETVEVACTDIYLDVKRIVLAEKDESRMLYASAWPSNTTDELFFASSDEDVATVTQTGMVTAVGPGTAWITVTCGEVSVTCDVECTFDEDTTGDTTDNTEETEDTNTTDEGEFKLNRKDITFSTKGESWIIYDGKIALSSITWTSDNEAVATITNGNVVAVGSGQTTVYGEYNGQKVSCIIRCSFVADNQGGSGGNVSEDGGNVSEDGGGVSEDGSSGGKTVITDINVRNRPGTTSDCHPIGTLSKGDKVEILETKEVAGKSWGKIAFGEYGGWICLDYVE